MAAKLVAQIFDLLAEVIFKAVVAKKYWYSVVQLWQMSLIICLPICCTTQVTTSGCGI